MYVHFADQSPIKLGPSGQWSTHKKHLKFLYPNNYILRYDPSGWPVRSVERLPPYSPKQLKYPVLVIGNTVRAFFVTNLPHTDPRNS